MGWHPTSWDGYHPRYKAFATPSKQKYCGLSCWSSVVHRFNAWALVVWPLCAPACVGDSAWRRGCSIACSSKDAKRVYMQPDTDMDR